MKYAIVDTAPVSSPVPGTRGVVCFDRSALFTLAHNLACAASLERAFRLGDENAREIYWRGRDNWIPNTRGEQAP